MPRVAVYWDSSAILSVMLEDRHSIEARRWITRPAAHLLSTLAWAEVHGVMARAQRERALSRSLLDAARAAVRNGPWYRTNMTPEWHLARLLAQKWPLHGPDLWHLAAAMSMRSELPELVMLTFDERLRAAAQGEGLA